MTAAPGGRRAGRRSWTWRAAIAMLGAAAILALDMAPASASMARPPRAAASPWRLTCGEKPYTVPAGTWLVTATLAGASGANVGYAPGGLGGRLSASIGVFPGQRLVVDAGCTGHDDHGGSGYGDGGNGGRAQFATEHSAGGGGGSAVRRDDHVVLLAAGGGGGGGSDSGRSGVGGAGGKPAGAGRGPGGSGGCGGCQSGPDGGNGASSIATDGGGGGGGYRGGGGASGNGSGGGGGLSFAAPLARNVKFATAPGPGSGTVTLTPAPTPPPFTQTFSCQGQTSQAFSVPDLGQLAYTMDIRAAGGGGGGLVAYQVNVGGHGGVTAGSVQVLPGDQFTVDVGCDGDSPGSGASAYGPGGPGGPGIDGRDDGHVTDGSPGSTGGGASAVMRAGRPLLVAGGGGGGGGFHYSGVLGHFGGNGGNPAVPGESCSDGSCVGGSGGTEASTTGGSGSRNPCPALGLAQARDFAQASGGSGGGGGGWRGGAGGSWPACSGHGTAAGGGGGLSFADADVSAPTFTSAAKVEPGTVMLTLTPVLGHTAIAVATSVPNPALGDRTQVTVTLGPAGPWGPVPTGKVSFTLDGVVLGTTRALDGRGMATSDLSPLLSSVGAHPVTVSYSGDAVYAPTRTTTQITVGRATPAITLSVTPSPLADGDSAAFTATIAPAWPRGPVPTGKVQFTLGDVRVGGAMELGPSGSVTSGTSEPVMFGLQTFEATYLGDANYLPGTAIGTAFAQDETILVLKPSHNPIPRVTTETLTFTATAQPTAGITATPTGTVRFSVDNGAPLIGIDGNPLTQPVALVNGVAQTPVVDQSKLTLGLHTVVAAYSGDGQFQAATTNVYLLVVKANPGEPPPPGSGNGGLQNRAALSTASDRPRPPGSDR